jgi:carbonic anhydrase
MENNLATSPTQLSLKKLKADGYVCQITERWNAFAKIRVDLFGFVDVLAIKENETLAVQTTSYSNISARVKKISDHDNVGAVRKAGWKIHVHGWHKVGSRWECKVVDVS